MRQSSGDKFRAWFSVVFSKAGSGRWLVRNGDARGAKTLRLTVNLRQRADSSKLPEDRSSLQGDFRIYPMSVIEGGTDGGEEKKDDKGEA